MDDNLKKYGPNGILSFQDRKGRSSTEKLIITVFWDVTLCSLEHVH